MKKIITLITLMPLLLVFTAGCGIIKYTNNNSSYDEQRNTFSELDYYGEWINVDPFGEVWRPNAGYNWRPYDAGQWELTDKGWMWFSDEPYGWIVYHYGYWAFTDLTGWVWIPGYEWSPSRVSWITHNDYIGWAPIPPPGWGRPNIYETNGDKYWMIVRATDFDNREIYKYRVGINSFNDRRDWNSGQAPEPGYIRSSTGRNIERINTQTDNVRGGSRQLTRIRIKGNDQNTRPSQPVNNQNNFTPPPASRNQPQQQNTPNNRTNIGDRNVDSKPQNVQPTKTRGDLVEPKRVDKKPVEPIKEIPLEKKHEQQKPVIRNDEPTRTGTRVINATKKPIKIDDIKKQKKEEPKINPKDDKEKKAEEDRNKK